MACSMGFGELRAMESRRKILNENIYLHGESDKRPLAFQWGASKIMATPTVNALLLKLLQYFGILINMCDNASLKLIMVLLVHTMLYKDFADFV